MVPRGAVRRTSCRERLEREVAAEAQGRSPEAWLRRSPAWAFALAVHLVIGVVLMNIVHFTTRPGGGAVFRLAFAPAARPAPAGGAEQGDQDNGVNGKDNEDSAPAGPPDPADLHPAGPGAALPGVAPLAVAANLAGSARAPGLGVSGLNGPGGLFAGRGGAGRGEMLRQFGGDGTTEAAVEAGLDWLARHQDKDGGWGGHDCARSAACTQGVSCYRTAVSSLALLAFLAHGHTHADPEDPRSAVVRRAMKFLLGTQTRDGAFAEELHPRQMQACMYSHGIATFALAELFAMTQEPLLRDPLARAVTVCADAQQSTGGWDYTPIISGRSDLSVSTWHVQALRAARLGGIAVPRSAWDAARGLYEKAAMRQLGAFPYQVVNGQESGRGSPGISAAGALARHYLELPAARKFDSEIANQLLTQPPVYDTTGTSNPPATSNGWNPPTGSHYCTYYSTLFLFHQGGAAWAAWNTKLKAALPAAQAQSGCEKGSWSPEKTDFDGVGRVAATAIATLDLEIYYRYLPSTVREAGDMGMLIDEKKKTDPELLAALESTEERVRLSAGRELARRAKPEHAEAMLKAARTASDDTRADFVEWLALFPASDPVADFLISLLSAKQDPEVRDAATQTLQRQTGARLTTAEQWRSWFLNRKNLKAPAPADK